MSSLFDLCVIILKRLCLHCLCSPKLMQYEKQMPSLIWASGYEVHLFTIPQQEQNTLQGNQSLPASMTEKHGHYKTYF